MALTSFAPNDAIEYYRDDLICYYEAEHENHTKNYSDVNLKIIALFYGHQKLQQEYKKEIAELWDGMDILN